MHQNSDKVFGHHSYPSITATFFTSRMTLINTNRPRVTASPAHTHGDRSSANGKIDSSQRLLLE